MNWIDEIRYDIRTLPQSPKILRKFGLIVGTAFVLISLLAFLKGWPAAAGVISGSLGLLLCGLGVLMPVTLRSVHTVWMGAAVIIGSIVSRIILSILFFVVISPIAFAAKMMGKRFIQRHRDHSAGTYWVKRDPAKIIDYEKMY